MFSASYLMLVVAWMLLAAVQGYTITAPAAGAVLYPGRTHRIQWAPADTNTIDITLTFGTNIPPSQATFPDQQPVLSATVQASSGFFDWPVSLTYRQVFRGCDACWVSSIMTRT